MKRLKIAFGLAVVAGLMAVVAAPAMAVPRWVHCVKGSGPYTNGTCATLGAGGWETKELVNTSEVTSSGELELEDSKAPEGGTAIKCTGENIGWVTNLEKISEPGQDGISAINNIKCKFIVGKHGSCEESKGVTVHPTNLPWGTKLIEEGTQVRDDILSGAKKPTGEGFPGWEVECTVGGVLKITDVCEHNDTSVNVVANRTTGKVASEFETKSNETGHKAKCTIGGAEAGNVNGTILSLLRSGNALWILAPNLHT
jgi:hypothetical protein